ncbi:MAG: hypothetical protein ACNI3C_09660 [Candidatus Marinarcus sp.]|uniref:hypothetical protein n=1 Tax=Candidatus Marinarcus sp. TaxID=3100987 RepID=UPI003AFFB9CD
MDFKQQLLEIIYQTQTVNYWTVFIFTLFGFFTLIYIAGFLFAKVPFVNKMVKLTGVFNTVLFIPYIFSLISYIKLESAREVGFVVLLSLLFVFGFLIFILAASKTFYEKEYSFLLFLKSYKYILMITLLIVAFYSKTYLSEHINFFEQNIKKQIYNEISFLKQQNNKDFELAKIVALYHANETQKAIKNFNATTTKVQNSFQKDLTHFQEVINKNRDEILMEFENKMLKLQTKNDALEQKIEAQSKLLEQISTTNAQKVAELQALYNEWQDAFGIAHNQLKELKVKYEESINAVDVTRYEKLLTAVAQFESRLKDIVQKIENNDKYDQENTKNILALKELLDTKIAFLNNVNLDLDNNFKLSSKKVDALELKLIELDNKVKELLVPKTSKQ